MPEEPTDLPARLRAYAEDLRLPEWVVDPVKSAGPDLLTAAAGEIERLRREVEFIEIMADGGKIMVNDVPWREMFARYEALLPVAEETRHVG